MKNLLTRRYTLPLFCLLCSLAVLAVCSRSSPLYATNDWVDANIYFTIGRGMHQGLMPYRDLLDHKGPLLYLLHWAAAAVSSTSFFGVWLRGAERRAGARRTRRQQVPAPPTPGWPARY